MQKQTGFIWGNLKCEKKRRFVNLRFEKSTQKSINTEF
jgi:hypothetical protein